jgi:hypothetical protein
MHHRWLLAQQSAATGGFAARAVNDTVARTGSELLLEWR